MSGIMRILKSEPNERIDYELELGDDACQMVGRLEMEADGACTRVVWKCAWDLAQNPYRRYFDLAMCWMIRRDFAAGLENLKALVESAAQLSEAAA
jgi:hypothetical protein